MLPEPNPPFIAAQDDSELEWLLCLASAMQARDQQAAKAAQGTPGASTGDAPGRTERFAKGAAQVRTDSGSLVQS